MNNKIIAGFIIGLLTFATYSFFEIKGKNKQPEAIEDKLTLLEIGYIPSPKNNIDDFQLTILDIANNETKTEVVNFSKFAKKPTILHFWATWCGPCVEELPEYDIFAQNKQFNNVAICVDKNAAETVFKFCKSKSIANLTIACDSTNAIMYKFKVSAFPTTIFIDANGKEKGRVVGTITWNNKEVIELINNNFAN